MNLHFYGNTTIKPLYSWTTTLCIRYGRDRHELPPKIEIKKDLEVWGRPAMDKTLWLFPRHNTLGYLWVGGAPYLQYCKYSTHFTVCLSVHSQLATVYSGKLRGVRWVRWVRSDGHNSAAIFYILYRLIFSLKTELLNIFTKIFLFPLNLSCLRTTKTCPKHLAWQLLIWCLRYHYLFPQFSVLKRNMWPVMILEN